MKVALITDTHWGVRGDNVAFLDMNKRFLDGIFFPKIQSLGIQRVVHLGDVVDRRKYINIYTAKRLREDFIDQLTSRGLKTDIILGNHDVYYKNTNSVNALHELYGDVDGISIHDKAVEMDLYGMKTLYVPWICAENKEHSMETLAKSNASVCMGHLEIQGFQMYRGSVSDHGEDRRVFEKFDVTLSGHFHHRSSDKSIHYLGSHGQFTWSDYPDDRGFHIIDTETREIEFVVNPYDMFAKVHYDDSQKTMDDVLEVMDFSSLSGKYVKVIVKNKLNPFWFDTFCSNIEKSGIVDMQIVEDHLNLNLEEDSDIVDEAESTLDVFKKHISTITAHNVNTVKLNKLITDLYNQAVTVE